MSDTAKIPDNLCGELKELFTDWAWQHSQESPDSTKDTFPCQKSPDKNSPPVTPDHKSFTCSFCPDGYTTLNGNYSGNEAPEIDVLFVLKESNVSNEGILRPEMNGTFWFDKCVNDPVRIRYKNRFEAVLDKLYEDRLIPAGYSGDTSLGYMNINKRGGYGSTNMTRLRNYAKEYKCMINRQICIMNPKIIVCFGCFGLMDAIINKNRPVLLIDMHHPSYPGFNASYKQKKQAGAPAE